MDMETMISDAEAGDMASITALIRVVMCRASGTFSAHAMEFGVDKTEVTRWMCGATPPDPMAVVSWCARRVETDSIALPKPDALAEIELLHKAAKCEHEVYYPAASDLDRSLRLVALGLLDPSMMSRRRGVAATEATRVFLRGV